MRLLESTPQTAETLPQNKQPTIMLKVRNFIPALAGVLITSPQLLAAEEGDATLIDGIINAGAIGFFIILMSVVAMALVIEHFMTIKREKLAPTEIFEEIEELLRILPLGHPHITEMTDFLCEIVHEWQDIGDQIQLLGARVSILDPGHVEWHGVVDGELVMYSWCQGEGDIEWWYPLGLSTTERRPLIEA